MVIRFILLCSLLFMSLVANSLPLQAQENSDKHDIYSSEAGIQAITGFTISPNPAEQGSTITLQINFDVSTLGTNRLCLYYPAALGQLTGFANQVTSGLQDIYTHTAGTGPGAAAGLCPLRASFYAHQWQTETVSGFAIGGDVLSITANLPSAASGLFTFSFLQFGAGGGILNTSLTIAPLQQAPVVYVDPANQCGGNTPCYTTLAAGVTYVEAGGVLNLYGTLTGVTVDKDLTLQSNNMATIGGTIEVTGDAVVTLRGLNLTHSSQAFTAASDATIIAYGNNIAALNAPVAGTAKLAHNWWGSYLTQPSGVAGNTASGDWSQRLGAPVVSYGLGTLGQARVTFLNGVVDNEAVIVSHGREEFRAPFGQATSGDGNTQCSDYYDIFVPDNAAGERWVFIPIDDRAACTPVYEAKALFMFDIGVRPDGRGWETCTTHGDVYRSPSCWYGLQNVIQGSDSFGRRLRVTLPVASLQYTPFVGGNENMLDPTAISLVDLRVDVGHNSLSLALIIIIILTMTMTITIIGRTRSGQF